jgi:hypothetical protein
VSSVSYASALARDLADGGIAEVRSGPTLMGYRPAMVNGRRAPLGLRLGDSDDVAVVVRMPNGNVHAYTHDTRERARYALDQAYRATEMLGGS